MDGRPQSPRCGDALDDVDRLTARRASDERLRRHARDHVGRHVVDDGGAVGAARHTRAAVALDDLDAVDVVEEDQKLFVSR